MPFEENGYDFPIPDEMKPWVEAQRRKQADNFSRFLTHYILVRGKIKAVGLMECAKWFEEASNRRVDITDISKEPKYPGGTFVSTVFLSIDHSFSFFEENTVHVPILFETMVFGGKFDQAGWRYSTWRHAKKGHWMVVDAVRGGKKPALFADESPWNSLREMFGDEDGK